MSLAIFKNGIRGTNNRCFVFGDIEAVSDVINSSIFKYKTLHAIHSLSSIMVLILLDIETLDKHIFCCFYFAC